MAKGHKTGGRGKGTPNKATVEVKEVRVKTKRLPKVPQIGASAQSPDEGQVTMKKSKAEDLLQRLGAHPGSSALLPPASDGDAPAVSSELATSTEGRWNAALGCKTSEVALAILAQVTALEHPKHTDSDERVDKSLMNATAMLAELQPTTATEALLAAQMVGTQRLAMTFLASSTLEGQTVQGADAHILRATRLMRLFNEQVETMARLKGKSGQQRVVVEHVTVAAGGQAIVGTVIPGGRGASGDDPR